MRLLLIEDERTLCDAVARRLRRSGYSVDLAYDGERALQCCWILICPSWTA